MELINLSKREYRITPFRLHSLMGGYVVAYSDNEWKSFTPMCMENSDEPMLFLTMKDAERYIRVEHERFKQMQDRVRELDAMMLESGKTIGPFN